MTLGPSFGGFKMIRRTRIDDIVEEPQEWLIEGIICPWLTLLSGQPKHGKSSFSGHVAVALIQETPLLGRKISGSHHLVAWMGYDSGWKQDISFWLGNKVDNRIIAFEPIRSLDIQIWRELAQTLMADGVTLFILDHLYGMAGALGLNDAEHFALIANLLRPIYEEYGIAVLLLAQAGKGEYGKGRAAHSVAIEGEARALIRIYEKRANGARKIDLSSNSNGEETISVTLTPESLEIKETKSKKEKTLAHRESPDAVRKVIAGLNPNQNHTWSSLGRELERLGISKSASAGRQMTYRWREQDLLKIESGVVIAGDSLIVDSFVTNVYTSKYASGD
jgi:hypothetical protein